MFASREMKKQTSGPTAMRHGQVTPKTMADTRSPDAFPDPVYFLQRYLGNSYLQSLVEPRYLHNDVPTVQRACACGGSCANCVEQEDESEHIQPKLIVGQPDDVYEREADRVADTVMRLTELQTPQEAAISSKVQGLRTQHLPKEGEEALRRQPFDEEDDEETLALQAKGTSPNSPEITPDLAARIHTLRGLGQPLSESARALFEPRFGYDFSPVRVHAGARAAAAAQAVRARAFTVGSDIVFGAGQHAPYTVQGRRLLAHELVHVVQQQGHRMQQAQGMVLPGDAPWEQNAKRTGASGTPGAGSGVSGVDANGMVKRGGGKLG